MRSDHESDAERRGRIERAIGAYLEAVDAGRAPDPSQWVAQHPDLQPELAEFLSDLDRMHRLAEPLQALARVARGDAAPEVPPEGADGGSGPGTTGGSDRPDPEPTADFTAEAPAEPDGDGHDPDLPRGRRVRYFGDYELGRVLGRGGMGVVYKAKQLSLNRPVAVKMIRAGLWAGDDEVRRFRNEAEAIANLDHPQVVTIHEVGQIGGRHYFSMRLVEGPSLDQVLDGLAAEPRRAARIVGEIARAVHHAHQRGLLHRDLKPSNILLDAEGRPHVTDFGLARRLEDNGELSLSGSIVGTPSYMSPEQAAGTRRGITTATDVYGLGSILYACLTGRPPFQADSLAETLQQVHDRPPPAPSSLNRRVPRDLEVIALKCLEKDPRRRYGSAEALADDLERFLRGEPILARRTGPLERSWLWSRRHPAIAALGVALAVSLVIGTAASTVLAIRARAEARRADGEAAGARLAKTLADRRLYAAHMNLVQQAWERGDVERVRELLRQQLPGPNSTEAEDLRGFEWYYADRLYHSDLLSIPGHALAFSPDGRHIAMHTTDNHRSFFIWDLKEGRAIRRFEAPDAEYVLNLTSTVSFSPDGRLIAAACLRDRAKRGGRHRWDGYKVHVWDVASGRLHRDLPIPTQDVQDIAFSPDGRLLAVNGGQVAAWIWEVEAGRELRKVPRPYEDPSVRFYYEYSKIAFSPDGSMLAFSMSDGTVRLLDCGSGESREVRAAGPPVSWQDFHLAFSPDGRQLAGGSRGDVWLWDVESGEELHVLRGTDEEVTCLAFSPDGRRLATGCEDKLVRLWDTRRGMLVRIYRGHGSRVRRVAFWPDAGCLVSSDGSSTRFWDATSEQEHRSLTGWASLAFSPDGRVAATVDDPNVIRLWDLDTGLERLTIRGRPGMGRYVFSPDGRRLAVAVTGAIQLWDTSRGTEVLTIPGLDGLKDLRFSRDGTLLIAHLWSFLGGGNIYNHEIQIRDAASGRLIRSYEVHSGPESSWFQIAPSPDGPRGVSFSPGGIVRVSDPVTGREVLTLTHAGLQGRASEIAFSPDGRWIATAGIRASRGGFVWIWDAQSGRELRSFLESTAARIESSTGNDDRMTFSPDGARLITGGWGQIPRVTTRIWDTLTGLELFALDTEGVPLMSPDGRRLAQCSGDGVLIRDAMPEDSEARSRRIAGARLRAFLDRASAGGTILGREELADQIREDAVLRPEDRVAAFTMIDDFRDAALLREADRRIADLLARPLYPDEAAQVIQDDSDLDKEVRRIALELTGRYAIDALAMKWAFEEVALRAGARSADYERALRMAEDVLKLYEGSARDESDILNTMGCLLYRLGRFDQAKLTLERSAHLRSKAFPETYWHYLPYDDVLLAMVVFKLGHADLARTYLRRVREHYATMSELAMVHPALPPLFAEAEALIGLEPIQIPDDPFASSPGSSRPGQ